MCAGSASRTKCLFYGCAQSLCVAQRGLTRTVLVQVIFDFQNHQTNAIKPRRGCLWCKIYSLYWICETPSHLFPIPSVHHLYSTNAPFPTKYKLFLPQHDREVLLKSAPPTLIRQSMLGKLETGLFFRKSILLTISRMHWDTLENRLSCWHDHA